MLLAGWSESAQAQQGQGCVLELLHSTCGHTRGSCGVQKRFLLGGQNLRKHSRVRGVC